MVVAVLVIGVASQLVASRLRLPAIVVLLAVGLTLGPVTGLVAIDMDPHDLSEMVGLGVAIILFEGGMSLRFGEVRHVSKTVGRLVTIGPLLAMALGASAAHYIGGMSWGTAAVIGGILVVTGPTVILPLLRQARLKRDTAAILKWEGIVNDPTGVLLAILAFQWFTNIEDGIGSIVLAWIMALGIGVILGAGVGYGMVLLFRLGIVPDHLKAPTLLVIVLLVAVAANAVVDESGLLAVTIMGIVMGNVRLPDRERLLNFKEPLTVLLLSVLFILIPSTLTIDDLRLIDVRVVAFLVVMLLLVRPATVWLSTIGAGTTRENRTLVGWIAPRGIVAAATAGVVGPGLVDAGYEDANKILPTVFAMILVTVVLHGVTLGPLARRLGLSAESRSGLLIIGASEWTVQLATRLKDAGVSAMIADDSYHRMKSARMAEVRTYYGEILSDDAEVSLDLTATTDVLCATSNDYYNSLVAGALGPEYGFHRVFQLTNTSREDSDKKRINDDHGGVTAFDEHLGFFRLQMLEREGWEVRSTKLTEEFSWADWKATHGTQGEQYYPMAQVSADGELSLYRAGSSFSPKAGATAIYFARGRAERTGDTGVMAAVPAEDEPRPAPVDVP